MMVRLNRFLARCGVASRRGADAMIAAGHVRVGGRTATLGETIDEERDVVTVRGRRIAAVTDRTEFTLALNKPLGVVTTMHDERGRASVAGLLPSRPRLFPVGRLDAQTSGLLLCTNDGELARLLTHPSSGVPKRYEVVARGTFTQATAAALGATGHATAPDGSHRFAITLTEGKNRQVRRMCARAGLRVLSLTRTHFGPIALGKLKIGCTRALTQAEMRELGRLRAERG